MIPMKRSKKNAWCLLHPTLGRVSLVSSLRVVIITTAPHSRGPNHELPQRITPVRKSNDDVVSYSRVCVHHLHQPHSIPGLHCRCPPV